jgi:hypothetical protein
MIPQIKMVNNTHTEIYIYIYIYILIFINELILGFRFYFFGKHNTKFSKVFNVRI